MFTQQNKKEHLTSAESKQWQSLTNYINLLFSELNTKGEQNINKIKKILIQLQIRHFYNRKELDDDIIKSSQLAFTLIEDMGATSSSKIQMTHLTAIAEWVGTKTQEKTGNETINMKVTQTLEHIYDKITEGKFADKFIINEEDETVPDIIKFAAKEVYKDQTNYLYITNTTDGKPTKNFELESSTLHIINQKLKKKNTTPANTYTTQPPPEITNTTIPTTTLAVIKQTTPQQTITAQPTSTQQKATSNYYRKKLIVIDSKYRYDYHNTQSNSYTYNLSTPVNNVREIKLEQTYIKNNTYNININNNQLRMNIHVTDVKRPTDHIQNIIIPKGNYFQNKTDTETNLDLQIKNLFNLYEEFSNVSIFFNYKNSKYYFYQNYSYILAENSHMYNIFFNFGRSKKNVNQEDGTFVSTVAENRLITKSAAEEPTNNFTNILPETTRRRTVAPEDKQFLNKSIGEYLGFYPNIYSTHISKFIKVNYFQSNTLKDNSSGENYNILQFNIINSETLFQKIYDLIVLAKRDMFIGFVLESPLNNNKCKHAILKLEPNFCTNIITHRSNPTNSDLFGVPIGETVFTIEIYLKKKLHQFPKYNKLIEPELITTTPNLFSSTIILPVISDKPYELNNDNYMLLHLSLNGKKIPRLSASQDSSQELEDAFTQFRTEVGNQFFINSINTNPYIFNNRTNINSLQVELYDKHNSLIDLNNSDHSFVLELTYLDPHLST